jgi:hypothetical protein
MTVRARRRTAMAAAALLATFPLLTGSAGAEAPAQVPAGVAYGAGASGAVLGITFRIPATSAGGIGYADSNVNLSGARARSASFYPGFLVDAFFKSSCNCAYNPTDTIAQNPPSSSAPEKSRWEGSQATPAGEQLTLVAETPSLVEASSRLVTGELRAPSAPVAVDGGRVETSARVEADGTVVTEVTSMATGVDIAGTVLISNATSMATTTTSPGKTPVMEVTTKVGSVLVNGVRSELSEKGLVIADRSAVTPEQVAAFNSALKALEAQGVFVSAVQPVVETSVPGFGEVLTGAVRIRYQVRENPTPNDVGTDTDLLVASVSNLASSQDRVMSKPGAAAPVVGALDESSTDASGDFSTEGTSASGAAAPDFDADSSALMTAVDDVAVDAPVVSSSAGATAAGSRATSLLDLLSNSKKGGVAPKLVSLYGWLVAAALLFAVLPVRILARRRTA